MNYQIAYKQINEIMRMTKQEGIQPLPGIDDNMKQLQNLKSVYLDRYIKAFPQWEKFRTKPEAINDIGMQFLLKIITEAS